MEFNLRKTIKALLFSSDKAISIEEFQKFILRYYNWAQEQAPLENDQSGEIIHNYGIFSNVPQLVPTSLIQSEIDAIEQELERDQDVYRLNKSPEGYYIVIATEYSDWVRIMRDNPKPAKLSQAALETLAIIAYRQPVTRAEIEHIRGVSADSPMSKLQDMGLINISGKSDLPGKPLLYSTTDQFLEYCSLSSLNELPKSGVIRKDQLNEWMKNQGHREDDRQLSLPFSE